ncbi:hypothetical protein [Geodermatophilus sp. URMC 65]
MLGALWVLWRRPLGRRRPELLACSALATVQIEVAWMVPRVEHVEFYLLGFTLAIYASGCLLVTRPLWTGVLVAVSWSALGVAVLTTPRRCGQRTCSRPPSTSPPRRSSGWSPTTSGTG